MKQKDMGNKFGKGFKDDAVVFDPTNNAVWVSGTTKKGKPKDSGIMHFQTKKKAFKIARQLAMKKKIPIWHRDEGRYIQPKKTIRKKISGLGLNLGKFGL